MYSFKQFLEDKNSNNSATLAISANLQEDINRVIMDAGPYLREIESRIMGKGVSSPALNPLANLASQMTGFIESFIETPEFTTEFSDRIREPKENETEDEFVDRTGKILEEIILEKLEAFETSVAI